MTRCQHCHAETQLYLCDNCQINLTNMLTQLPWLIDELDARIQKLDRIGVGTIGRNRRPDEMNIIDFDAAETARNVRKKLTHWCQIVAVRHTGRQIPSITTVHTKQLAQWLEANVSAIAKLDLAHKGRHTLYDDITHLVGQPTDPRGGQLHQAINRHEHRFAGPCPTITSHDHNGEPIECGEPLYADIDETETTCPACGQQINADENRRQTEIRRDLMTEPKIREVMDHLGEHLPRVTFYRWIRELRIRPKGWLNKDHGLLPREDPRRRRGDPAVYSLARARRLRTREESGRLSHE